MPKKIKGPAELPENRYPKNGMIEINGIIIPYSPGTFNFSICCVLAHEKDRFVSWNKIYLGVERYIRQYAGVGAWSKFVNKKTAKNWKKRIQQNAYVLTRLTSKNNGRHLHQCGMAVYFFRDGLVLYTGGKYVKDKHSRKYEVVFPDGKRVQKHNGMKSSYKNMKTGALWFTFQEYRRFVESGFIDKSCSVLNAEGIHQYRKYAKNINIENVLKLDNKREDNVKVCVSLSEDCDSEAAFRLESCGFIIEQNTENQLIGTIPEENIELLEDDDDVLDVEKI